LKVLPIGLCSGSAAYDILLAGIQWQDCIVYLDDVIVLIKTFEDHFAKLYQNFSTVK